MPVSKKSKLEIYVNPPNIEKGKDIHFVINNDSSSDTPNIESDTPDSETRNKKFIRDHSFSTYAKFPEKLTFLTP